MKLHNMLAGAAALTLSAGCVVSANAAILVATYTGTVTGGGDYVGVVFGAPGTNLVGDSYVATYTINTANGILHDLLPSEEYLVGGSYYGASSLPVSATITINGYTQSVTGNYQSEILTYSGGTIETAYDLSTGNIYSRAYIDLDQQNVRTTTVFDTIPLTNVNNNGTVSFVTEDTITNTLSAYAMLTLSGPGTFQITSDAPEPATWAMMLLGLGAVGAAMRFSPRNRFTAAAAA